MGLWGQLYQGTLVAVAYAVGGETPTPRLRQKTHAINIMSATAVSLHGQPGDSVPDQSGQGQFGR
ncbi:hypothetical protein BBP40_004565 [Aspergillus hancockii]|nr:hypothetical protein BBP40_004565 [Aspergillus hancockii]